MKKLLAALPAIALVLVSVWEAVAARRDASSVPGDAAWAAAEQLVRAQHRPGDLIVFAPDWIDPVGRLHLGDLLTPDMAGRMDAARYGRIWELSIRGAHSPDVAGLSPVFAQTVDGVTVRRFERAPAIVLTDFASALPTARSDGAHPTLELAEVGFAPHRCVQVTPAPNKPTRITFPGVRLGATLAVAAGLADVFTRRDIRSPGTLAIEIGGAVVAQRSLGIDDGWVPLTIATTPGTADVTFIASATAPQRLICFAAESRDAPN